MGRVGIRIESGSAASESTRWIEKPIVLGRAAGIDLTLDDAKASRQHARLESVGETSIRVRDLGSSNGTFVNGRRVIEAEAGDGDVIQIGTTLMRVVVESAVPVGSAGKGVPVGSASASGGSAQAVNQDEIIDDASGFVLTEDDLVDIQVRDSDNIAIGKHVLTDDYERSLETLAMELPPIGFGENDIRTFTAKGRPVHDASPAKIKGPRDMGQLIRMILHTTVRCRSSDIHLEPQREHYMLRLRVDGVMIDAAKFITPVGLKVASAIKVLADIDLAGRETIQEGRFSAEMPGKEGRPRRIDYRVSFAPGVFGQKLVIRSLDPASVPNKLQELGLPVTIAREIADVIALDSGMVLVGGPTGSGKTTSLYALLRSIDSSQRNVITIEDPVEIQLDGITQLPVDNDAGRNFPTILRSVLRQDPDVILVGEVRDSETAKTALQASITGHLVFSTLHAKDTLSSVARLHDLGVDYPMIAQGLQLVLSQRLVRTLCTACRKPVKPTPEQRKNLGPRYEQVEKIFEPGGCGRCLGTGFSGRRAIFEMLSVREELRRLIARGADMEQLEACAKQSGFIKLHQSGYDCVGRGLVAYAEVDRAVGR